MVFNATFNNISAISWLSVLLVEETEYLTRVYPLEKTIKKTNILREVNQVLHWKIII